MPPWRTRISTAAPSAGLAERPEKPSEPPHCMPIIKCSADTGSRRAWSALGSMPSISAMPWSVALLTPPTSWITSFFSISPSTSPSCSKKPWMLLRSQPRAITTAPTVLGCLM
ncbi:hypothetical protein D3C81_1356310 [compost metagenome]